MLGSEQDMKHEISESAYTRMKALLAGSSDEEKTKFLLDEMPEFIDGYRISGYSRAVKERSALPRIPGAIDIVGTGGDGKNTINVSTAASVVVSAMGHTVVKHGNFGSSNHKGSADFMRYLGYNFSFDGDGLKDRIGSLNFAFLLAPLHNDSFAKFAAPRKAVAHKTVFNYLGPITNPADPETVVLGAADSNIQRIYAEFIQAEGKAGYSLHASDGMDEVSPFSETVLLQVHSGKIRKIKLNPEKLLSTIPDETSIVSAVPERSFTMTLEGLSGKSKMAAEFIALNAAPALAASCSGLSLEEAYGEALNCILSGAAYKHLRRIVEFAR
ncbi:MAG: anthranilate phosphoribosyltransferase [Thermoplasmataceae archaeon]